MIWHATPENRLSDEEKAALRATIPSDLAAEFEAAA